MSNQPTLVRRAKKKTVSKGRCSNSAKSRRKLEDVDQEHLFNWSRETYFWCDSTEHLKRLSDYLFAIPNGGLRNKKVGADLKKQGVKAGVSDTFLPVLRQNHAGLWIELKVGKNKASELQLDWIVKMTEEGYKALVCWGWKSAARAIEEYLGGLYTATGVRREIL